MTGSTLESELKYRADGETPLIALAAAPTLGPATLGPARTVDELDRYLDTASLRLAARSWACRLRTREGRTIVSLKGPAEHLPGAALHERREIEGPAMPERSAAGWPVSEARDRLLEMAGGEPLIERLAMAQQRTERAVLRQGAPTGTLSLDRVRVVKDGREIGQLLLVELELDRAALADGFDPGPLASALANVTGLRADPLTKLEHALDLASGRRR
ncbi:MAG: CYTH domain-containing protein [Candidatus Limnocylindria bacterium]